MSGGVEKGCAVRPLSRVPPRHAATPCEHGDLYREGPAPLDAAGRYNLSRVRIGPLMRVYKQHMDCRLRGN